MEMGEISSKRELEVRQVYCFIVEMGAISSESELEVIQ